MSRTNRDIELDSLAQEDALSYAQRARTHFARKAEHNKRESLGLFVLVITATLAVSGFVAFGNDTMTGKIIPLCLSLIATATSTWLQFRKPHQLWAIYRSAQRYVENAVVRHRFDIDEYDGPDKDKVLAKNVAQIVLAAHELWVPLVPSPERLERLRSPPAAEIVPRPGEKSSKEGPASS